MANQQVYQAYPQNKGTLIPGQTISVNNYTVQVERYLSQGGFAHVYLVRTPTPVYNTTHHVLKRIAVANESMLTDVKKEVDIMRLLKGHPNIVHLIDAAWHKLPNGTFEVFILMEFCPGGGIIDMMNRRLRERLTEVEILQIFVDVCEGVAYMHNSRPPLLHRDLKVENILQSSPTSFKLCDFGSATTVTNPPTNMQEIRALEADLNRHTTLQYRAPEMVDVYSKRPVNEKSDVWALGVLLYKLCYYTTPFEEHGPLAILNVQYRIPPYPVYSQDMNLLIASMLREHGAQRPTVFELLNHVHRLRGTKSKFSYNVPAPSPLLPRPHVQGKPPPSPSPNPMEGLVTYGGRPTKSALSLYDPKSPPNTATVNQGIQARDKVLEAIAPMRRGRPASSKELQGSSRPASPQKSAQSRQTNQEKSEEWLDNDFAAEQEKAWRAVTEKTFAHGKSSSPVDDAWNLDKLDRDTRKEGKERPTGFGDDFAEELWNAPNPNSQPPLPPRLSPRPNVVMSVQRSRDAPITHLAYTGSHMIRPKPDRLLQARDKDAFEGLGLMANTPKTAPTLGEARMLRTGLAIMSTTGGHPQDDYLHRDADNRTAAISQRPTPSPQSKYLSTTPLIPQSVSPVPTPITSSSPSYKSPLSASGPSPSSSTYANGIESRFPSLEELDARFNPPTNPLYPSSVNDANSKYIPQISRQADNRSQYSSRISNIGTSGSSGNLLKPSIPSNVSHNVDGVRSEQVTGIAMREPKESRKPQGNAEGSWSSTPDRDKGAESNIPSHRERNVQPKPLMVRKHRSREPAFSTGDVNAAESSEGQSSISASNNLVPPKLPPRPSVSTPPRDWLTGDDYEDLKVQPMPEMPILRNSPSKRASFIENSDFRIVSSSVAQHVDAPERNVDDEPLSADLSPTVSNFKRAFPAVEKLDEQRPQQSFSSGLTESWSPVRKEVELDSSSADEGPEDPRSLTSVAQKRQAARAKGRQSSVHELVHQYGGGLVPKEKEKEEKEIATEKVRERPPVQYNVGASDYTPRKSRPSGPGLAPPATQAMDRKTPSPTSNVSRPPSTTPSRPQLPPLTTKPQPTTSAAKPPASARSRPQSMFIFPSKSVDSSSTPSTNTLAPPQESRPRATRRTSISDMVQRYEAIGGAAKSMVSLPPGPPSPIYRPVSTKTNLASMENGRIQKSFPDQYKDNSSKVSMSNDSSTRSGGDPLKARTPLKEPIRQTTGVTRSPSKAHRKFTSEREKPALSQTTGENTPRPRRISVKAEPSRELSLARTDTVISHPTKVPASVNPNRSPRKPASSLTEDTSSRADEPRSPSPERPYQGVGKLIDQWQKKSAEADQSRVVPPGKRGDFITKRTGIVHGNDR
ncbi:hypothetical protein BDZ97DRAFT_1136609 [Flammula alnicola]|nr:hypothetical protein BDZ97DRAFT_1136609 [Flammula alnicola]